MSHCTAGILLAGVAEATAMTIRYSLTIQWSDEDQTYVVSLPEWGDLIRTHGATYEEALVNGQELIQGLIEARRQHGEPLPPPRVFASA